MSELPTPTPTQGLDPAPPDTRLAGRVELASGDLRQRTARGTIVNGLFLVGLNFLGLLRGFIVAGLVSTSDYGVWGILAMTLAAFLLLKRASVGGKYVQQSELDQEAAFQKAFTFEIASTGGFMVLLLAAIPLLALVYGREEIVAPGLCLAAMLPATALSAPTWVFYRRMEFVKQRAVQAVDPVVGFVVAVGLAVAGAGYWGLVAGVVAGVWAGALVAVIASPYPLTLRWDSRAAHDYFSFSWPVIVASLSTIVIAQGSVLVGEGQLGLAGVGAIVLAATIAQYADRVDAIVTETLYPAICAVQDRADLLYESFVKSNRLALMWGVPFGVGLALFAPDLVEFGIGDKWDPAVVLLQTFGLTAAAGHLGFNWHAFYRARGETRPMAVVAAVTMVAFLAAAVPLLVSNGLPGFALGIGIMTAVTLVARSYFIVRLFPGFSMVRWAARAVAPTVPAIAVVLLLRVVETGDRTLALALGELALYLAVTAAATIVLEKALLREVVGYLRRPAARGAPAA
jgi:O-antigen/teichoic acid export membrane protein